MLSTFALLMFSITSRAADLPVVTVPNAAAFIGWEKQPFDIDELDLAKLKTTPFACVDHALQPLSQDQSTKKYHKFLIGKYSAAKLRTDDEACLRGASSGSCSVADTIQYTIMSDIYSDSCGHRYRAYWQVLFMSDDESMGTLCSLGRTFYEKSGAEFPGEIEIGPTYPVDSGRFLFFTGL